MDPLTIVFYTAVAAAVAASAAAVLSPPLRTRLLGAAALLFTVAGVLGILSLGAVFLVAAGVCLWQAAQSRRRDLRP